MNFRLLFSICLISAIVTCLLTGCSSTNSNPLIPPELQDLADSLTVMSHTDSQQSSSNHSQPVVLGLGINLMGTPSYDADGWLVSTDTFSTGTTPGSGTDYTLAWRYRMYNISGEVVTDTSLWNSVDRIEWLSTTASSDLTSHSYRLTSGMINYRDAVMTPGLTGTVEMTVVGTDETVFANGFVFRITSFEAYDGITLNGAGGNLFYRGTAEWTASNEALSGTLAITGPSVTDITYSGTVKLYGITIGTISYNQTTKNISLIDNNGNTITPH